MGNYTFVYWFFMYFETIYLYIIWITECYITWSQWLCVFGFSGHIWVYHSVWNGWDSQKWTGMLEEMKKGGE